MEQMVFAEHSAFLRELEKGVVVCTTAEIYDHFLNVLPPAMLAMDSFTFGEGDEGIYFWKKSGKHFARYGFKMVANSGFSCWAYVRARRRDLPYTIVDCCGVGDVLGNEYPDIESMASALGIAI